MARFVPNTSGLQQKAALAVELTGQNAMNIYRPIIGFLVAVLAVPILAAAFYYPGRSADGSYLILVLYSAVISFHGVFLLGLPAYLFLRARKWTAFWIAPLVGFIVAAIAWSVFALWVGLALGLGLSRTFSQLMTSQTFRDLLWPIGPIGAAVGALLWLIARPDRTFH
jgi:hypothetical protein